MHTRHTHPRQRAQPQASSVVEMRVSALTLLALFVSVFPSSVFSAPPDRWDVSIQASAPHNLDIWRGESLDLRPRFLSYGTAWNISTSATITLYWSTNNFASSPWATNGTLLAEAGRVSVTWSPACDAGAATYQYFIGVSEPSGLIYRARGTIRMQASPGFVPSTAPLPVWDGWTNGYIYATYAALLSASNALAAGQQATSNALALALQAEATRAQQAEASAVATAQAALAAGLTGASNYTDRATAAGVAAGLATGTAARALSAARLDQYDSQAWVTVAAGTATLWRVETSTNYITYLRCVNAGSADINGLYYAAASSANTWIHTATAAFVFNDTIRWIACVNPNVYYHSGTGDSLTNATWTRSYGADPLPVFSFTNIYTSITNRYPLAGYADLPNLTPYATTFALAAASNAAVATNDARYLTALTNVPTLQQGADAGGFTKTNQEIAIRTLLAEEYPNTRYWGTGVYDGNGYTFKYQGGNPNPAEGYGTNYHWTLGILPLSGTPHLQWKYDFGTGTQNGRIRFPTPAGSDQVNTLALLSDISKITAAQVGAISNTPAGIEAAGGITAPTATNIASTVVSAYAAPSFPVYDYGLRTNVVFVLSNSVLYLYER